MDMMPPEYKQFACDDSTLKHKSSTSQGRLLPEETGDLLMVVGRITYKDEADRGSRNNTSDDGNF